MPRKHSKAAVGETGGGHAWIGSSPKPLADVIVAKNVPSDLADMLLVASGSVPAELHWGVGARPAGDRPTINVRSEGSHVVISSSAGRVDLPWDGSREAYANVTNALTGIARMLAGIAVPTDRRAAALAVIDAAGSLESRFGPSTSSYVIGARMNVESRGEESILPNVTVALRDLDRVLPGWRGEPELRSHFKLALRSRLTGASPAKIAFACDLVGSVLGLDSEALFQHWNENSPVDDPWLS